jgi:hypothetical protein
MIIIRLSNKKENKYILALRIESSVLYIHICIKHIHINLDNRRNAIEKIAIYNIFKVLRTLGKIYDFLTYGVKMLKINRRHFIEDG